MIKFILLKKLWFFIFQLLQLLGLSLDFLFFRSRWRKSKTENIVRKYYDTLNAASRIKRLDINALPLAHDIRIIYLNKIYDGRQAAYDVIKKIIEVAYEIEIDKQFFDLSEAFVALNVITSTNSKISAADWITLKNDKITVIHMYYVPENTTDH